MGMGPGMGMGGPGMGMGMMGGGGQQPTPVMLVADGVLYIACDGKVTAFELKTLNKLAQATYWERPAADRRGPGMGRGPAGAPGAAPGAAPDAPPAPGN